MGRTTRTRIVRAILAMGTPQSTQEFPEIWVGETLELQPRQEDNTKSAPKVNNEDEEWGDIRSDDEDVVMEDITYDAPPIISSSGTSSRRSSIASNKSVFDSDSATDQLGGMEAIKLRQRFLALVCV